MLSSSLIYVQHWHGLLQHGTNYNDGPAFVTQCPIVPENSYQYDFRVPDQVGIILLMATFLIYHALLGGNVLVPFSSNDSILRRFERPSRNI
jgi:hypothetical protein